MVIHKSEEEIKRLKHESEKLKQTMLSKEKESNN